MLGGLTNQAARALVLDEAGQVAGLGGEHRVVALDGRLQVRDRGPELRGSCVVRLLRLKRRPDPLHRNGHHNS